MKNLIRHSTLALSLMLSNVGFAAAMDSSVKLPSQYHQLDKDISINAFELWHELASPAVCAATNLRDFRTLTWMSNRIKFSDGAASSIVPVGKELIGSTADGANKFKIYFIDLSTETPRLMSRELVVNESYGPKAVVSISWAANDNAKANVKANVKAIGSNRVVATLETGKDMCEAIQLIRNDSKFASILKAPFEKTLRAVSSTSHQ